MATEGEPAMVRVLRALQRTLDELGIEYVVTGSVASGFVGEQRLTHDVDVLVEIPADAEEPLLKALAGDFYVPEAFARTALRSRSMFNVLHLASHLKVDLIPAKDDRLTREQFATRTRVRYEGAAPLDTYIAAPEVIVLSKLDWFRRGSGASDQQWRDIKGVLKVQGPRLNLAYLRQLAEETGLTELVARALTESGLS